MTYKDIQEYENFKLKLIKSVNDLKNDYSKLSAENKINFKAEIKVMFPVEMNNIINFLNSRDL